MDADRENRLVRRMEALWYERKPLYQALMRLRPQMAQAAQKVYDSWHQDETGFDEMYSGGGVCHDIADKIVDVIYDNIHGVNVGSVSMSCGEVHVLTMVYLDEEGYAVDIHPSVYETGGGYSWTKIPDVEFSSDDITISFVHPDDVKGNFEYEGL